MIWILIQEILGNKEKSLENDDLVPTLQCMDAGNWRGKDSHLFNEDQLTESNFGWLCTKFAKYSKIQIASERQAISLGTIGIFFIFRTFILVQISLFLVEKEQGHFFVYFREN